MFSHTAMAAAKKGSAMVADRIDSVVDRNSYQHTRKSYGVREARSGTVPDDVVSRSLGRLEIEIKRANFDAARRVIDQAEASIKPREPVRLTTHLEATDLHVRIVNALAKVGIYTIGAVLNCEPSHLLKIPGMGQTRLDELLAHAEVWAEEITAADTPT